MIPSINSMQHYNWLLFSVVLSGLCIGVVAQLYYWGSSWFTNNGSLAAAKPTTKNPKSTPIQREQLVVNNKTKLKDKDHHEEVVTAGYRNINSSHDSCSSYKGGIPHSDHDNHPMEDIIYCINTLTGDRCPANPTKPYSIDNEYCHGVAMLLLRPPVGDTSYAAEYFRGRKRQIELQVQVRFKKQPKGNLWFGVHLDHDCN